MNIQKLIEEFVDNARKDRNTANDTYEELVGNELHTSTSATFFRAKQEANKQLMEAAQMLLKCKEVEAKLAQYKEPESEEGDIFADIKKAIDEDKASDSADFLPPHTGSQTNE